MSLKHTRAVIKINRETKDDKLTWRKVALRPTSLSTSEELRGPVYESKVLNRDVILYKYQAKHYTDEDEYFWLDGYNLDFVDKMNITEWTFPNDNSIHDLYETVRFKMANVSSFLDEYLEEEEETDF